MSTSFEPKDLITLIGVIAGTVATLVAIVLQYRRALLKEQRSQEAAVQSVAAPEAVDNLSSLLVQNFKVLNTYYSENLRQARTSTLASISISIVGFVVIIGGITIAFVAKETLIGTVRSAAGVVSETAAALFFRQNRVFLEQMRDSLGKLVSTQYLMTSFALLKELSPGAKDDEVRQINSHLRSLMDSFHANLARQDRRA
jgi:hypothetical protein